MTDHKTPETASAAKNDYRDTVFLPETTFPMRGSLPQKEPELLARWKRMDLYTQMRAKSAGRPPFILHDGPPYANGNIHIGHALNKILKDTINRTQQMLGFDAPYVPGWDCHGLPIEWKIEEQYRAKGVDKDKVPTLDFRAECRAFAEHWKGVQSEEFQRLGISGDWAHPYTTMTKKAEAQICREIHKFLRNGLLYKGVKPVMWSVVEKTALAEAEIEYHDHTSTSLWIKFPVVNAAQPSLAGASIIIWTTTPWTLPANRAIAYGDFAYSLITVKAVAEGAHAAYGDRLVVAEALLESFVKQAGITEYGVDATLGQGDFTGVVCRHPFRGRAGCEGYFDYDVPMHFGEFVTTDAGTGFVHIAPGHGEDDFHLGHAKGVKFDETVGDDGRYLPHIAGFAGLYVYKPDGKVGEANGAVIKAMIEQGCFVAKQNVKHSYPHSWRSKAPLIFRTTPQWFIALDKVPVGGQKTLRELALDAIGETRWVPAMGENRIRGMIETRPDWCISRQRAWGVPIALFVHKKTGETLMDEAVLARITDAFEKEGADAWYSHAPADFLGAGYNAEDYAQVFDIVDVWFESGSTHSFCLNQDLGASEWPELRWPASLYLEGSDQHRGWFHSSLLEGCGTIGRAPFDAVLTHGFTLDEQGRKMSKSLGNVTAPQEVMDKMGADILRLWVMASDYGDDLRIGNDILKQIGDLYRRFRNTLRYMLGALAGMSEAERVPVADMPELERWVLHRLTEIDKTLRADWSAYNFNHALMTLHDFCNADLSAFYFDIRKDALYCDRPDSLRRRATRTVMGIVFDHLTRWLAPILCFTAEEAYLARYGDTAANGAAQSVHLETFLTPDTAWHAPELGEKWVAIRGLRRVVTGAMEELRNKKTIGSSLQAHPTLYTTAAQAAVLNDLNWAEICIASSATIVVGGAPAEAYRVADVPDCGAVVTVAEGHKCDRCWQILPEVGQHKTHVTLCLRCVDAVENLRKEVA